jgi:acylphosphatase
MKRVIVRGRVQGVGFRAWVADAARAHGVTGWVRNRRNGSVEAVFAGGSGAVAQMVEACRQGPRGARVDVLEQHDASDDDLALRHVGEDFSMLPTR